MDRFHKQSQYARFYAYRPWAIRVGTEAHFLMNIFFEKRWEQVVIVKPAFSDSYLNWRTVYKTFVFRMCWIWGENWTLLLYLSLKKQPKLKNKSRIVEGQT